MRASLAWAASRSLQLQGALAAGVSAGGVWAESCVADSRKQAVRGRKRLRFMEFSAEDFTQKDGRG